MSIVFKNGKVVTMDFEGNVIEGKDVLIEDNKIIKIAEKLEGEEVIDCSGKIIMPGFINTHCHAAMWILPQLGGMPVKEWLEKKIWPLEKKMNDKDFYIGTKASCVEMLRSGITCFADMYFNMKQVIAAIDHVGIRAFPGATAIGPMPDGYCSIGKVEKFIKDAKKTELVTPIVNAHAPYTCSKETLLKAKELADTFKTQIHIHVSEGRQEVEDIEKKYGKRSVEWLDEIGFLGKNVVFDHAIHLSDEEIDLMAGHKIKVSHCPVSNEILDSGIIRLKSLMDAGVVVSLGTDSKSSNTALNMFQEMRKAFELQHEKPSKEDIVKLATINGAKALDLEKEIGSIEVGKKADMIVLDTDGEDVYSAIMDSSPEKVLHVLCNGKFLIKDKEFTQLKQEEVFSEAEKAKEELLKR